ncbi:MAG: hypothetical protein A2679_00010 [Candidatus Sungbacteria bacterium RIFCSPHIGHO2_01_FULL_54_26]|nr:MAG: hypothetical protein A2679_00010 [Candidatus Sungbacteria bacterium RIFCSPHIGHO2_01_FULL_54_26]
MNQTEPQRTLLLSLLCGLCVAVLVFLSVRGQEARNNAVSAVESAGAGLALVDPMISAEAYVVRLTGRERPIIGRRADKPLAPASLTKVMTAVVAAEKLAPADSGVMSAFAKNVEERKSTAQEGDTFLRDDLIRMTLVMSANDAALALAERVGQNAGFIGSVKHVAAFVAMMNAKAHILGMSATHFENPTGLDMPRHTASANDMARLAEYVLVRHPFLWAMSREQEAKAATTDGKRYAFVNSNDLVKEFPALVGGKTGLTDNAKEALLLLYPVEHDRTAIIVILRSDDRFGDGRKIIHWLEENF